MEKELYSSCALGGWLYVRMMRPRRTSRMHRHFTLHFTLHFMWPTANGQKMQIMLEQRGVPCEVGPGNILRGNILRGNILRGRQFAQDVRAVSPHNKIPPIIDNEVKEAPLERQAHQERVAKAPASIDAGQSK
jgi:hypothetical protein